MLCHKSIDDQIQNFPKLYPQAKNCSILLTYLSYTFSMDIFWPLRHNVCQVAIFMSAIYLLSVIHENEINISLVEMFHPFYDYPPESKSRIEINPPQQKCYLPTLYKTKLPLVPFFFSIYLFSWSSLARKVGAKWPYTLPPKKIGKVEIFST